MAKSGAVSPVIYVGAVVAALVLFGTVAYLFMQIDPPAPPPGAAPPPSPVELAAAADANPGDPAAWARLCAATAQNYWRDSSPADCDRAVELQPESVQTRLDRAFLHLKIGRPEEAREAFDWVLARQPGEPRALFGRGLIKIQFGDVAGSEPDRRQALAANPNIVSELEEAYGFRVPSEYRQ